MKELRLRHRFFGNLVNVGYGSVLVSIWLVSLSSACQQPTLGNANPKDQGEAFFKSIEEQRTKDALTLLAQSSWLAKTRDLQTRTPLHWAARTGQLDLCRALLQNGAEVNAPTTAGFVSASTPMHSAAGGGQEEICRLLLNSGGLIDARDSEGATPLMRACIAGHLGVCKVLVEGGSDLKATSQDGNSALHWAVLGGNSGVCKLLLTHGADASMPNKQGRTPLHLVAYSIGGGVAICQSLLEHKSDVRAVDDKGNTPLHLAASSGLSEIVALLLKCGANPATTNKNGDSALVLARRNNHEDVETMLQSDYPKK